MNKKFITAIILLLIAEVVLFKIGIKNNSYWLNTLRIVSNLILCIWYYRSQKPIDTLNKKLFLISLLLPLLNTLSAFIFSETFSLSVNIMIYVIILGIWAFIFKQMGAKIKFNDKDHIFFKIVPAYFLLPVLYYAFALHQSVPKDYVLFVLLYFSTFAYTGSLAAFLPISENSKLWISWSIVLIIFSNIIVSYHIFLEKLPWTYIVNRILTVLSRCMLVYGIVMAYKQEKPEPTKAELYERA